MITLAAFADRAVGTALPTVVRDFDALASFGLANAAPAASFLVALAVAGGWADRRGPLPVLRTGVAAFAVAQLLVGLAWAMPVVVLGRLVSGAGEALVDVSLMVLVARVLHPTLRPRMFSLVSAAWILPSVLGPVVTGVVTEQLGWRWVFLGVLVLVGPTWLLLRPAIGSAPPVKAGGAPAGARMGLGWALLAGTGVLVLTAGRRAPLRRQPPGLGGPRPRPPSCCSSAWCGCCRPGRCAAPAGLPTVVAVRGLVSAAFGAVGAFLPLLLTLLHGFRPGHRRRQPDRHRRDVGARLVDPGPLHRTRPLPMLRRRAGLHDRRPHRRHAARRHAARPVVGPGRLGARRRRHGHLVLDARR